MEFIFAEGLQSNNVPVAKSSRASFFLPALALSVELSRSTTTVYNCKAGNVLFFSEVSEKQNGNFLVTD